MHIIVYRATQRSLDAAVQEIDGHRGQGRSLVSGKRLRGGLCSAPAEAFVLAHSRGTTPPAPVRQMLKELAEERPQRKAHKIRPSLHLSPDTHLPGHGELHPCLFLCHTTMNWLLPIPGCKLQFPPPPPNLVTSPWTGFSSHIHV